MLEVSVIIPIYNKETRLSQSIESVLRQTYKNFELILLNDGSTDSSTEIIKKYENIDSRIVFINQKNIGVSASRNKGIEVAKGKYVTFLDADDLWDKYFLEKMVSKIQGNNVCYSGHLININGRTIKARNIKFNEGYILEKYIYNETAPHTNSWLIRKQFLKTFQITFSEDLDWGEDMLFFTKILFYERNVKFVNEYLTTYFMFQESSLSENNLNKISKDMQWMDCAINFINETDLTETKVLQAFYSYRIPAAIIYRLNQNIKEVSSVLLREEFQKYSERIGILNFSNKFRSFKLNIYYLKLRVFFILNK